MFERAHHIGMYLNIRNAIFGFEVEGGLKRGTLQIFEFKAGMRVWLSQARFMPRDAPNSRGKIPIQSLTVNPSLISQIFATELGHNVTCIQCI